MYLTLRIIRAVIGIVAAFQFFGTARFIRTELIESHINSDSLILLALRLIILAVSGGAFLGLRKFINHLHTNKLNTPHPALNKPWAL
ncbi:hypothetical protein ACPESN_12000 [Stutzerimonas marianensis]|uniref:hypothetical protein n=1 Tax=Stutzerimonas marianensis TaxID=2929513 RepID=UPI003C3055A4